MNPNEIDRRLMRYFNRIDVPGGKVPMRKQIGKAVGIGRVRLKAALERLAAAGKIRLDEITMETTSGGTRTATMIRLKHVSSDDRPLLIAKNRIAGDAHDGWPQVDPEVRARWHALPADYFKDVTFRRTPMKSLLVPLIAAFAAGCAASADVAQSGRYTAHFLTKAGDGYVTRAIVIEDEHGPIYVEAGHGEHWLPGVVRAGVQAGGMVGSAAVFGRAIAPDTTSVHQTGGGAVSGATGGDATAVGVGGAGGSATAVSGSAAAASAKTKSLRGDE